MPRKPIDMTGERYGRLTVIDRVHNGSWRCKCDCGNYKNVRRTSLISGNTRSCGCLAKQVHKEHIKKVNQSNRKSPEERKTQFWLSHDPFLADVGFLDGFAIVNGKYPDCQECGKPIELREEIKWEFEGHRKRLIHTKHRPLGGE